MHVGENWLRAYFGALITKRAFAFIEIYGREATITDGDNLRFANFNALSASGTVVGERTELFYPRQSDLTFVYLSAGK